MKISENNPMKSYFTFVEEGTAFTCKKPKGFTEETPESKTADNKEHVFFKIPVVKVNETPANAVSFENGKLYYFDNNDIVNVRPNATILLG